LNYISITPTLGVLPTNKNIIVKILKTIKNSSSQLIRELSEIYTILINPDFNSEKIDSFNQIFGMIEGLSSLSDLLKLESSGFDSSSSGGEARDPVRDTRVRAALAIQAIQEAARARAAAARAAP
jgi:hypothetical protein